ncbi:MAG: ATP-binding protein [Deltaproteobacteria bacterium]|nr:ATP-binding protein [Deltaproteobacteria bacterium]
MIKDQSTFPDYMISRLRWLMLSRVMIVSFLLGLATFIQMKGMESLAAISTSILFKAIIATYLLSILFLVLLKKVRNLTINIYVQCIADIALITGIVYATGGIQSIYSVFYPLVIIYAVFFLSRKGGFIIASVAAIFYGLFSDLEFYGMIYPLFPIPLPDYPHNVGYVFTRMTTHIISFYLIAFLASFVVEQEKKARKLLAEKQNAFEELNLLYRSIIQSVDTGILTIDLHKRIKSFNRAAAEITGLSFQEVENRLVSDVFTAGPRLAEDLAGSDRLWAGKTRFEIPFPTAGKTLSLGGAISPLRDHQGQTIGNIVIFQDLTEINEMRETIEKNRRLSYVGEMAACLAHEIRNPLAAISGSIQLLKEDLARNETNEKLMQIIFRGKDQLENFLKDFLLLARPAPGVREKIDLREILREVIDSLRCVEDWHEPLQMKILFPEKPLLMEANKTEIRQIFWNLILNSLQAMPEGGSLKMEAGSAKDGQRDGVQITITDTGRGIALEDLKKIYEPFYTTRDKGTGLGLAVVKRIIDGYEGKIMVQSEPGKGTCCTVWLAEK